MGRQKNKISNATEAYWHDAVEELFAHPEKTIKQVAQERQVNAHTLGTYILNHYRERWEEFCREERGDLRGRKTVWAKKYEAAVVYIKEHPEERLGSVAYRFGIYSSTPMAKYIRRHYPDLLPWRKEWNNWQKVKTKEQNRLAKRAEMEEAKSEKERERERERERAKRDCEKRRARNFKELDASVVPFAERMEAMQKRLNDIRDGLGDNFEPGELPLLKVTPGGYSVKEWQKKQHTLDIIMRRMEQVKRMRGRA